MHDLRRSAARALRAAGVPQSIIKEIGGWKTDAMFERYAIKNQSDHKAAMAQLLEARKGDDPPTTPFAQGAGLQGTSKVQ